MKNTKKLVTLTSEDQKQIECTLFTVTMNSNDEIINASVKQRTMSNDFVIYLNVVAQRESISNKNQEVEFAIVMLGVNIPDGFNYTGIKVCWDINRSVLNSQLPAHSFEGYLYKKS